MQYPKHLSYNKFDIKHGTLNSKWSLKGLTYRDDMTGAKWLNNFS